MPVFCNYSLFNGAFNWIYCGYWVMHQRPPNVQIQQLQGQPGKNISVRMIRPRAESWTQLLSNTKRIIYWQTDNYFLFFCFHAQTNSSCFHSADTLHCPTVHCKLQHTHLITASIYKQVYVKLGYMTVIRMAIATLRPENKSHKLKYVIKLSILFHDLL
jgi:hypothetical protein